MGGGKKRTSTFGLSKGRILSGKYEVQDLLGSGWEGEVYHVTELDTGFDRAVKLFFPERNPGNKAVTFYARKLEALRDCPVVIRYHTRDCFQFRRQRVTFLVSEYVRGELLPNYVARQRGKRLSPFEALHLLHALTVGLEQIHRHGEYHGDVHDENIIVQRVGLGFRVKLVDFFEWGRRTKAHIHDDVCSAIRVFYDTLGGPGRYAGHPAQVKRICLGLKRSLITKQFPTARHLREHIETLEW